jgi:hypothetical protein
MILELGKDNVETLLQDKSKLDMAVKKAKAAIDISNKDTIGEEVFQETEKIYPEFADKITGMQELCYNIYITIYELPVY